MRARYDFVDYKAALLNRVSISGQKSVMLCSCERMYKSVQYMRCIYIYIYIYIYMHATVTLDTALSLKKAGN